MSETINTLFNRRSIRTYKPVQIKDEELSTILKAGQYAPSARNDQSWHFTVVQNPEVLEKISSVAKAIYGKSDNELFRKRAEVENFSLFYHAPTYIIVSGENSAIAPEADGALALGNLFLAAADLGIGSVWIHAVNFLKNTEEGKALFKELGIPDGYSPIGSGAFGYNAGEAPNAAPRREGTITYIR